MQLFFRHIPGDGLPVLILHGLFGSSRNWLSHGKDLSTEFDVYLIDHRNHGDSPWDDDGSLHSMIADAVAFQEREIGRPAIWIGHSLGGLVAMGAALLHPDAVRALVVADIAPRPYPPHHEREFAALRVDVAKMKSRKEVDAAMARIHPDAGVRQFLQMNLEREGDAFRWKLNVKALERSDFLNEFDRFHGLVFKGPALFLAGNRSDYVRPEDEETIRQFFPQGDIRRMDGDHWLHHTNYSGFMTAVRRFLEAQE